MSSSSSAIYYPGEFFLLVRVGQSFHCSPPPTLPIHCILLHYSPLFHVLLYHYFAGMPLFLRLYIFNSNTYFNSSSSSLTICPNHLNLFCLKCSSKSSTPTLDAITVLSTSSVSVTLQIMFTIVLYVAHSLCNTPDRLSPNFVKKCLQIWNRHVMDICTALCLIFNSLV